MRDYSCMIGEKYGLGLLISHIKTFFNIPINYRR